MVLQTYGLSISSDDECVQNRLIDDNDEVVISDRKSVNYSDSMLAMSPFAGDYPPTTNYINYTDLDASYAQGNNSAPCWFRHETKSQMISIALLFNFKAFQACTHSIASLKLNTISMSPEVTNFGNICFLRIRSWIISMNGRFSSAIFRIFLSKNNFRREIPPSKPRSLFNYGFGEIRNCIKIP